ncbi:GlcG/HbpS family heme-binding protein [Novosphingobium cyanobacteriorum]|uniref:Heme-binding protein n=1 Tax=Novosphingobium cyanobacteriorum TaxID=3024215 RepID=A0ABT6CKZ7_9SPHN|nr:heme-binding protein [Novosphingobium cyanobacteriorum]MDF8334582.1 heme-binding protein [Novosphingobium cyanobacteriorum]
MIETAIHLSTAAARTMVNAAMACAQDHGCLVVVAVVDAGGHLLLLERGTGAPLASIDVAREKARTAALYGFPTFVMEQAARSVPTMAALPNMLPFGGGIPTRSDGRITGAIGVSGGTTEQDIACAEAAIAALVTG